MPFKVRSFKVTDFGTTRKPTCDFLDNTTERDAQTDGQKDSP